MKKLGKTLIFLALILLFMGTIFLIIYKIGKDKREKEIYDNSWYIIFEDTDSLELYQFKQ